MSVDQIALLGEPQIKSKSSNWNLTDLELLELEKASKTKQDNPEVVSDSSTTLEIQIDTDDSVLVDPNARGGDVGQVPPVAFKWFVLVVVAHFGWGLYPVFARYLITRSDLPPLSLLTLGNTPTSVITLFIVLKRKSFFKIASQTVLPFVILITLARVITNLLAPKFTIAPYVHLATLMTPFMTSIASYMIWRISLPPYTIHAIVCSSFGAVLMFMSHLFPLRFSPSGTDGIGITLAFASSCCLAGYMLLVRVTTRDHKINGEELLFFLTAPVVIVSWIISVTLKEDWSVWLHIDSKTTIMFLIFSFGLIFGGNILQILSIRHLGAPLVSSLIAFRLVVALVFSAILLDETLSNGYQIVGAAIVLLTITVYLGNIARINSKAQFTG